MSKIQENIITAAKVPEILDDSIEIDVLFDYHEDAIEWYTKFFGWKRMLQFGTAEPRALDGKMTEVLGGIWLNSVITNKILPFHIAERGTVDPNIRVCFKVRDLKLAHSFLSENGIRVSDIYAGPEGHEYFDFWATVEGTRLTAQSDPTMVEEDFLSTGDKRIGVSDLKRSAEWYSKYMGAEIHSEHYDEGYFVISIGVNHHPDKKDLWILELLPEGVHTGNINGTVRMLCYIKDRGEFLSYHRYLLESGVVTGKIGGFTKQGRIIFYFYDPDGNRMNIVHYPM
jgi:catechol 2,3-dioxygenase-like lactoylglutathione lyase family enzyme